MENSEQERTGPRPQGIPRSSRLPRATGSTIYANGIGRVSQIPRSKFAAQPKIHSSTVPTIRSEGNRIVDATRKTHDEESYRLSDAQSTSPGPHLITESVTGLDGSNDGITDLDHATISPVVEIVRKKPRPSLSERTIETLSQVPPSPSPSRRRLSISGSSTAMPPPTLPVSPVGQRSPSSQRVKDLALHSPSKLVAPTPLLRPSATGAVSHTTPKRSKITDKDNFRNSVQHSKPKGVAPPQPQVAAQHATPVAHRVKSLKDLRASTKQPLRKASLNFKDISGSIDNANQEASPSQTSSLGLKPRISNPNTPSKLRKRPSTINKQTLEMHNVSENSTSSKSSASLRETIAKAKAAKKQEKLLDQKSDVDTVWPTASPHEIPDEASSTGISSQSLKRRIQSAVTSGVLNVAALDLKSVPADIMQMYDSNENPQQDWSEAVDLVKFIIADNDITDLPDEIFPDWSIAELQEDEDKSNIFGGLETLDFRGNKLAQIPTGLRRLERLHTLNLNNNRLDCDVLGIISELTNLRDLSLAKNQLEGPLPNIVSQLTNLNSLNLSENQLTDVEISFSSMRKLRRLDVSGNLLRSLPMNELEKLDISDLNVSRNRLSRFSFSPDCAACGSIQILTLSFNEITSLWKDKICFLQLQSLIIDSNQIQSLPDLSGCASLVTLTASENRMGDIPDGFIELQDLRSANFASNDIRILDPYISRMEALLTLNLAGNPLRDRKYLNMTTSDIKADLAKRLTAVYIRDQNNTTPIADESTNSPSSTEFYKIEKGLLDLSSHDIVELDTNKIDPTSTINILDLSKNRLQSIPTEFFDHEKVRDNLRSLVLSHNTAFEASLYIKSPLSLPALRSLSLASTGIQSVDALITHVLAPALVDLNLSCNRLRGPMPSLRKHFPSLTTLLISDNELTSITPDSISGLEVVDIRNNNIEFLPPKIGELGNIGDEKKAGRLRTFECSGNKFRVPRLVIVEKGTEAILRDLRRMVITDELGDEWRS